MEVTHRQNGLKCSGEDWKGWNTTWQKQHWKRQERTPSNKIWLRTGLRPIQKTKEEEEFQSTWLYIHKGAVNNNSLTT